MHFIDTSCQYVYGVKMSSILTWLYKWIIFPFEDWLDIRACRRAMRGDSVSLEDLEKELEL